MMFLRAQWGARRPKDVTYIFPGEREGVVIHYSAGPTTQTVRAIQDYHMNKKGWSDIGYNFLVNQQGQVFEGRGWGVVGAHATSWNRKAWGICWIGNVHGQPTPQALTAIADLIAEAGRKAGKGLWVKGHQELKGASTSCPGSALMAWLKSGRAVTEALKVEKVMPVIRQGSRGEAVKSLQRRLNLGGERLTVDGIFGPKTKDAVIRFQRKHGLLIDGVVGPQTWGVLL